MKTLIYLATPFNHLNHNIRVARYNAAVEATGLLLKNSFFVYSPIVHNYVIANRTELPTAFDWWREFDELMISRCDILLILTISGWQESIGVTEEIKIAQKLNKPIKFVGLVELRNEKIEWLEKIHD